MSDVAQKARRQCTNARNLFTRYQSWLNSGDRTQALACLHSARKMMDSALVCLAQVGEEEAHFDYVAAQIAMAQGEYSDAYYFIERGMGLKNGTAYHSRLAALRAEIATKIAEEGIILHDKGKNFEALMTVPPEKIVDYCASQDPEEGGFLVEGDTDPELECPEPPPPPPVEVPVVPQEVAEPVKRGRGRPPKVKPVEVTPPVLPDLGVLMEPEEPSPAVAEFSLEVEHLSVVVTQEAKPVEVSAPVKRGRGRPPKVKPVDAPAPAAEKFWVPDEVPVAEEPVKKKPGRPPKKKPELVESVAAPVKKKPGRPPKKKPELVESVAAPVKKKPGRPPKVKPVEAPVSIEPRKNKGGRPPKKKPELVEPASESIADTPQESIVTTIPPEAPAEAVVPVKRGRGRPPKAVPPEAPRKRGRPPKVKPEGVMPMG